MIGRLSLSWLIIAILIALIVWLMLVKGGGGTGE